MDEGGIYEEGTPDEIFDSPKKELTRRFIGKLKIFERVIESKNYDFIGLGSELDMYLLKNDVDSARKNRIRLVIEELVQQILMPKFEKPFIRIKVEYSLKEESCCIIISYKGPAFDVRNTDNTLSLTMIKNAAQDPEYSFNDKEEEANCVKIRVK